MISADPEKPRFPQAPSQAAWDAMTPTERAQVVATLPPFMTEEECSPPEGDPHINARIVARDSLRDHFERLRRRAYVGSDIVVYYPQTPRFAPDLFVVLDVEPGDRDSWIVSAEGKGLDFVLEVLYLGDRNKDLNENVKFYAELGIPEYFVYDRKRQRLHGFRLNGGRPLPILPQHGFFASEVLGMELAIEDGRLRFFLGGALVPEPRELLVRLQKASDQLLERLDEAERARAEAEAETERVRAEVQAESERAQAEAERAQAEAERAQAEAERAQAEAAARARAEAELAALRAELEALKRGT